MPKAKNQWEKGGVELWKWERSVWKRPNCRSTRNAHVQHLRGEDRRGLERACTREHSRVTKSDSCSHFAEKAHVSEYRTQGPRGSWKVSSSSNPALLHQTSHKICRGRAEGRPRPRGR